MNLSPRFSSKTARSGTPYDSAAPSEMRIDVGPGYRVYFMRDGLAVYVLLAGGDKSSQTQDIKRAIALANELRGQKAASKPRSKK